MVPGSEIAANMSWTVFDERTGNLYAVHKGNWPGPVPLEDMVSRWTMAADLSNITREEESINVNMTDGILELHPPRHKIFIRPWALVHL